MVRALPGPRQLLGRGIFRVRGHVALEFLRDESPGGCAHGRSQVVDELFVELLCSVLLGLTLAQPIMRLRAPRPQFREVVRQSGFVVCLAVIVGTLVFVDLGSFAIIGDSWAFVPAAVLFLLWPIFGLQPWNAERSWIDRLGRGVGLGWIVAAAGVMVLRFL